MNKVTINLKDSQIEYEGDDTYNSKEPDFVFTMEFSQALRSIMENDANIAVAIITAATDYKMGHGIPDEMTMLKERFPNGYKPSEW